MIEMGSTSLSIHGDWRRKLPGQGYYFLLSFFIQVLTLFAETDPQDGNVELVLMPLSQCKSYYCTSNSWGQFRSLLSWGCFFSDMYVVFPLPYDNPLFFAFHGLELHWNLICLQIYGWTWNMIMASKPMLPFILYVPLLASSDLLSAVAKLWSVMNCIQHEVS